MASGMQRYVTCILLLYPTISLAMEPKSWRLDKHEIMADGPVTVVLANDAPPSRELELRVDERSPIPLDAAGSNPIRTPEGEYILIWCDLVTSSGMQEIPDDDAFRLVPLFHVPGHRRVRLTTKTGDDLGSEILQVIPQSGSASKTADLLSPTIQRKSRDSTNANCAILKALATEWSLIGIVDKEELDRLRLTLAGLTVHPDWAPIAREVMRHYEMQYAIHTGIRAQAGEALDDKTLNRALEAIRKVEESNFSSAQSAFADKIREQTNLLLATKRAPLDALRK